MCKFVYNSGYELTNCVRGELTKQTRKENSTGYIKFMRIHELER